MSVATAGADLETKSIRVKRSGNLKDMVAAIRAAAVEINSVEDPAPSTVTVTSCDALTARNGITTKAVADILSKFWTDCTAAGLCAVQPSTGWAARGYTIDAAESGVEVGGLLKIYNPG